ncbi:hypothetical protein TAMA11512_14360 [Selenomonas sp. TAMA-11512]|uniref:tetratricopeptide repeat protein n=1 Tax=Selenomonas sp. TAMA-11512 TaxID=3095337 RepID=UPI00308F7969|nr:hypothetical protein TAMA11512_14360 [Selenomonas sp. TAMA-11512]
MNSEQFHQLTHLVMDSPAKPPEALFAGGFDDWHARAHLAHLLSDPQFEHLAEAKELFRSIVDQEVNPDFALDVETKAYALQRLSALEKNDNEYENALYHISLSIETAEESDFLYHYLLRGELWADRWSILHAMGKTQDAESECDERIDIYKNLPIEHNSYLYYGYRFKAQLAAERGDITFIVKDYMRMALSFMDIPESYRDDLESAFSIDHEGSTFILRAIDLATPNPDNLHWDI